MKKYLYKSIIILFCLLLCSCYDADPYQGQRPIDYPNSYWVCDEFEAFFLVNETNELIDSQIVLNEQIVPFTFLWSAFDEKVNIQFEMNSHIESLSGICQFNKNEFTVTISDTKGYFLQDHVTIKFLRQR